MSPEQRVEREAHWSFPLEAEFGWRDITPDDGAVLSSLQDVLNNGRGSGADWPESYAVALWITASGQGMYDGGADIPPKTTCYADGVTPVDDGSGSWNFKTGILTMSRSTDTLEHCASADELVIHRTPVDLEQSADSIIFLTRVPASN